MYKGRKRDQAGPKAEREFETSRILSLYAFW